MSLCGSAQEKEKLLKRLRRIEGQVRGLAGMVEGERPCMEVLQQIASVSGALRGAWTQVLGSHLHGCVSDALASRKNSDKLIADIMDNLNKLR